MHTYIYIYIHIYTYTYTYIDDPDEEEESDDEIVGPMMMSDNFGMKIDHKGRNISMMPGEADAMNAFVEQGMCIYVYMYVCITGPKVYH